MYLEDKLTQVYRVAISEFNNELSTHIESDRQIKMIDLHFLFDHREKVQLSEPFVTELDKLNQRLDMSQTIERVELFIKTEDEAFTRYEATRNPK